MTLFELLPEYVAQALQKPILLLNGSFYAGGVDDARKRFLSAIARWYTHPAPIEWLATNFGKHRAIRLRSVKPVSR